MSKRERAYAAAQVRASQLLFRAVNEYGDRLSDKEVLERLEAEGHHGIQQTMLKRMRNAAAANECERRKREEMGL